MTSDTPETLRLDGKRAFNAAVHAALLHAVEADLTSMHWVDPDFAAWPLDATAVELLTRWARPHRKLTLLARHYDEVPRRHPRFVVWRRLFSHLVECRAAPEIDDAGMPTLLFAGERSLQLLERGRCRGRWLPGLDDQRPWIEVTDSISQRSADAFPANTLGL